MVSLAKRELAIPAPVLEEPPAGVAAVFLRVVGASRESVVVLAVDMPLSARVLDSCALWLLVESGLVSLTVWDFCDF